ncbi:ROK family protein [Rhizobium laguerreae]|uniref:ROK family protein n=1 Tax=Rhizobium laguerreae TaxID=1076926 RepID=UPI0031BA47DE
MFGGRIPQPDPMFFIHIGHGVGGGAVIDGRPYRGVNGNACLPGVLYLYDQPRPSGQDLFATLNGAGFAIHDFIDLERLPDSAEAALEIWVERAGKQLSETVRVATAMFDPALIVLGGRLPELVTDRLVRAITSQPILGPSRGWRLPQSRPLDLALAPARSGRPAFRSLPLSFPPPSQTMAVLTLRVASPNPDPRKFDYAPESL